MPLDVKLLVGLHVGTLGLVLGLHVARGYITLGPVLALGGLLTFLAWQIAQAGWWVSWGGLNVNAALTGLTPAILAGATVVYVMDGVRAARAYVLIVVASALFATAYLEFLEILGGVAPMPNIFFLPLRDQLILAAAYGAGCLVAIVACEAAQRSTTTVVALPVGFAAGLAGFLVFYSLLTYGIEIGLRNLIVEYQAYLLAALAPVFALALYAVVAVRLKLVMPARPIAGILAIWKRADAEIGQARENITQARHVITELQELNRALETEQELRKYQVDNSPLAILEVDAAGRITTFNPAAKALLASNGRSGSGLAPGIRAETVLPGFSEFYSDTQTMSRTLSITRGDEPVCTLNVTVMPIRRGSSLQGFSVLAEDVTKRERARFMENVSSRVRSVHLAARMIAHDFTNLLTAVESNLDVIRQRLAAPVGNEVPDALRAIYDASRRGRDMLEQLSGGDMRHPELKPHRLDDLVAEAIRIETPAAREAGKALVAEPVDGYWVEVDGTQLLRVLMNLIANALRAAPVGGRVTIRTRPEGAGVVVEVIDTGRGMTHEQLERAFDPAFSTKGSGRGGLGLAISDLIVDAHGGHLSLESTPEGGTTARIWLPIGPGRSGTAAPERLDLGVLVLLDDADYRRRVVAYFTDLGCEVAELVHRKELQAVLKDEPNEWQVLVRDRCAGRAPVSERVGAAASLCEIIVDPAGCHPPEICVAAGLDRPGEALKAVIANMP